MTRRMHALSSRSFYLAQARLRTRLKTRGDWCHGPHVKEGNHGPEAKEPQFLSVIVVVIIAENELALYEA